jgi:succinate dehydrogenase/fumarate reductase flavoprotein subunit
MVGTEAGKLLSQRLRAAGEHVVRILDGGFLLDLDTPDGVVSSGLVYLQSEKQWVYVQAPAVVLATGGAGQLFQKTTNFPGIQGIGYALALGAGAPLVDMEFVCYEPTVAVWPEKVAGMEVPTMAFSEGARLLNGRSEEFLRTAPPPSKDVMSRAMLREVYEGRGTEHGTIYYDLREMNPEVAMSYSQIRRVLKALGVSPEVAQIEVMPTQHFLVGGVATDEFGAAEIPGLYAAGEVVGGAHGAHRLATCGGTEVIAMGAIAGESAAQYACGRKGVAGEKRAVPRPELLEAGMDAKAQARFARVRAALEQGCGALRDAQGLRASLGELNSLREELAGEGSLHTFVGRAVLVTLSIASSALARTESRGDHFRTDYPERDDRRWLGNIYASLGAQGTEIALSYQKAGVATRTAAPLPVKNS